MAGNGNRRKDRKEMITIDKILSLKTKLSESNWLSK